MYIFCIFLFFSQNAILQILRVSMRGSRRGGGVMGGPDTPLSNLNFSKFTLQNYQKYISDPPPPSNSNINTLLKYFLDPHMLHINQTVKTVQ